MQTNTVIHLHTYLNHSAARCRQKFRCERQRTGRHFVSTPSCAEAPREVQVPLCHGQEKLDAGNGVRRIVFGIAFLPKTFCAFGQNMSTSDKLAMAMLLKAKSTEKAACALAYRT